MGTNNRQRRAAKKRKRARRQRPAPTGRRDTPASDDVARSGEVPPVEELLRAAVQAWRSSVFHTLAAALVDREPEAAPVLERELARTVADLWSDGWAPADLVQAVTRSLSAAHGGLAAAVAVADGRSRVRRGERLHPRWQAQLDALEERHDGEVRLPPGSVRVALVLLAFVLRLGPVPSTVPPPGTPADARWERASGLDERILARVRALLAKAESTPFDEEAEALTAKAQELIARYSLDEALLHDHDDVGQPSVRRLPVDPPYVDAKAVLLHAIGAANRCRVIHSPDFGWVTLFGYDADLDAVELLGASLLAQATAAMARHGSRRDAAGRSRTRSFRRSFLLGFAGRIGERLREAADAEVAASDAGALLPVLAARDDRLEAAVAEAFPELDHISGSISNGSGYFAGRAAADEADLRMAAGRLEGRP